MSNYTKDELVTLVQENPEEFNSWKKDQDEEIDLSEVDFSNIVLTGVDFTDVDLNSSSFADSHLTEVKFQNCDLTSVDFTRSNLVECDFTDAILPGADFSYAAVNYCNFNDADMAGCIFEESDLQNSDFTTAVNMSACRFDEETVWPEQDMLPEDFDATYSDDLSSLKDDEDTAPSDY